MKTTRKILFLSFIITFAIFAAGYFVYSLIYGRAIDWCNFLSIGLGASISYTFVYFMGYKVTLKPKFAYLESDVVDDPIFGDRHEMVVAIEGESTRFIKIKEVIKGKWILTYFDEDKGIIKFRTKISFASWGAGGVLKIDADNKQVRVIAYPIAGYTQKGDRLSKQLLTDIEVLLKNIV